MKRSTAALGALMLALSACQAEEARSLPEGEGFDFYVLALSWSPSYCEIEGDRANRQQCGRNADHAFVVHGLWPQFERGWPEFCNSNEPRRVPDSIVRDMADIMPSGSLVGNQWRKHGTCTGLSHDDYFTVLRAAWDRVAIPDAFEDADRRMTTSAAEVEQAFIAENPGLRANGIAVTCDGRLISEARICLTKQLEFRSCPQVDSRGCRIPQASMPASGG